MKKNKTLQTLLFLAAIGVSTGMLMFVVVSTIVGYEVKNQCANAKAEYIGDCVEALTARLIDGNSSFRSRNSAIWALGQLGDARALTALESYFTGKIPNKESLEKGISQYELKKAIQLAGGGLNITAWAWDAD